MDNIVMIKQEIDFLIKNTQLTEPNYTLCLSELDYLNLCTIKKRSNSILLNFKIVSHIFITI